MRRLSIVAAAIVVAAGLGTAGAASAGAASASQCYGADCAGLDPTPISTGCNQYTSTHTEDDGTLATLRNWHSEGCDANWAQATLSYTARQAGDTMLVSIQTSDGTEFMCYPGVSNSGAFLEGCGSCPPFDTGNLSCVTPYTGSAPAYTDMVDGTSTIAKADVFDSAGNLLAEYVA